MTQNPDRGRPGPLSIAAGLGATLLALLQMAGCAAAGNGVQTESGPAILRAAGSALEAAGTYQVDAVSIGSTSPSSLSFEVAGPNRGEGSFVSPSLSFDAEELDGRDYFRSRTLWEQVGGSSLQAALGYHWVFVPAGSQTAAQLTSVLGVLTSPKLLDAELVKRSVGAVRVRTGRLDGQPVVEVSGPKSGTLEVAATGRPYPLRWLQSPQSQVTLSRFGHRFNIIAPRGALSLEAILRG